MLPELVNKSVRRRKTKRKGGKGNEDKSPKIKVDEKRVVAPISINNLTRESVIKPLPTSLQKNNQLNKAVGENKHPMIDMESLVDDCFESEMREENISQVQKGINSTLLGFPQKKRIEVNEHEELYNIIRQPQNLVLEFTLEEEFRLHDFLAHRDHFTTILFEHTKTSNPGVLERWAGNIDLERSGFYTEEYLDLLFGRGAEAGET